MGLITITTMAMATVIAPIISRYRSCEHYRAPDAPFPPAVRGAFV